MSIWEYIYIYKTRQNYLHLDKFAFTLEIIIIIMFIRRKTIGTQTYPSVMIKTRKGEQHPFGPDDGDKFSPIFSTAKARQL